MRVFHTHLLMSITLAEISRDEVVALAKEFETAPLTTILQWAWDRFGARAAVGTSFQGSGLVMLHHAMKAGLKLPVFTLDTGFFFPETMETKKRLEEFLGIEIESVHPEQSPAEQEAEHGPALWERSPDLCCTLRKVLPLQKKLEDLSVWITGIRRQQAETRTATGILELYEFDALRERYILKLNPMANWSRDAVWEYLKAHNVPMNPLHERGYRSIGCTHCTRPSSEGTDERAGRWTGFNKTECGIHTFLGAGI